MCVECCREEIAAKGLEIVRIDNVDPWIHAWDLEKHRLKPMEEVLPELAPGATEVWPMGVDLKYFQFVHLKKKV